jgi:DNA-binding protein HU-beta
MKVANSAALRPSEKDTSRGVSATSRKPPPTRIRLTRAASPQLNWPGSSGPNCAGGGTRCWIAAPATAATAKVAVQATVTLKHLAAELADSHDIAKKQAEAVLGDLVTLATRHLKKGDKIRPIGLDILQVRERAARIGRNPATGEAIKIKASKKIAFRPAKELTEAM